MPARESLRGWISLLIAVCLAVPADWSTAADAPIPAIRFRGIEPGVSQLDEVLQREDWGQPVRRGQLPQGMTFVEFQITGYRRVVVCARGESIRSVDVWLPVGVSSQQAADFFGLGKLQALEEPPAGVLIGTKFSEAWKLELYDAGKAALLVDDAGDYPVVELMRFYSDIAPEAQTAFQQGKKAIESRDLAGASESFAKALQIEPCYVAAYKEQGDVLVHRGELAAARTAYEAALEIYPAYADAIVHLGNVLHHQKRYEQALEQYERAVRLQPDNAEAHNSIAWLRATCPTAELRDAAQAIDHAKRACELTEWTVAHHLDTLGAAYAEQGDFELAREWAEKALAIAPGATRAVIRGQLERYRQNEALRE